MHDIKIKSIFEQITRIFKDNGESKYTITQLDLTGIKISRITYQLKRYLEEMKNLQCLCMSECELTTLENIPTINNLKQVELSNNFLKDCDLEYLRYLPNLTIIGLAQNKIQKLESVKVLASLKKLEELDFSNNKIEYQKDYRQYIFDKLKSLKVLDSKDFFGNLVDDDFGLNDVEQAEEKQSQSQSQEGNGAQMQPEQESQVQDDDQDEDESQHWNYKSFKPSATKSRFGS